MRKLLATSCMGLLVLAGFPSQHQSEQAVAAQSLANPQTLTGSPQETSAPAVPAPLPVPGQVMALVNGKPITIEQLERPLIDAYGLQFLVYLVKLELVKQKVVAAGLTVTPQDIAQERQRTVEGWFKDSVDTDKLTISPEEKQQYRRRQYEQLLVQLLGSRRLTLPEFELAMQTSAYLRKLAEPGIPTQITDHVLEEAFRIKYGERVHVRHIQLSNLRECLEAKRRIDAGEPFEAVAKAMSRNGQTARLGGDVRPFSRAERFWPQAFMTAAFDLRKPGDVSDPVDTADAYHLIRLVERIAPNKAVKFEDHKEILRGELYDLLLATRTKQLGEALTLEARDAMKIEDPTLRRQYLKGIEQASGAAGGVDEVRRRIEEDRPRASTQPNSSTQGGSAAGGHGEVARPPATMPGR